MTVRRATCFILAVAFMVVLLPLSSSVAQPRPTLNLVSMSDRFSGALTRLAPEFERATGVRVNVTIQSYGELYTRAIADFVGRTGGADLYTVDIVWTGEWAENGYLVDLTPMIQRDRAAIAYDDVFPSVWKLGNWKGKQYAFPLAAYAGVLSYNKKVLTDLGIKPPRSVPEFTMAIQKLTGDGRFGIVMNGARGAPCAQDWMYHMLIHGGSILDKEGLPALNTAANVRALTYFADMFKYAPPGATSYAWGDRELAFRSAVAMMQIGWSTGIRAHRDPTMSRVATISDITTLPQAAGAPTRYPLGGWGIGINRDSPNKQAAWEFIKWITSQRVRPDFVRFGGEPIRRSEVADPRLLAEFPWFAMVGKSFEHADGDFRPRIRQYPRIQDILGLEVNLAITGQKSPKAALDDAQTAAMQLFGR